MGCTSSRARTGAAGQATCCCACCGCCIQPPRHAVLFDDDDFLPAVPPDVRYAHPPIALVKLPELSCLGSPVPAGATGTHVALSTTANSSTEETVDAEEHQNPEAALHHSRRRIRRRWHSQPQHGDMAPQQLLGFGACLPVPNKPTTRVMQAIRGLAARHLRMRGFGGRGPGQKGLEGYSELAEEEEEEDLAEEEGAASVLLGAVDTVLPSSDTSRLSVSSVGASDDSGHMTAGSHFSEDSDGDEARVGPHLAQHLHLHHSLHTRSHRATSPTVARRGANLISEQGVHSAQAAQAAQDLAHGAGGNPGPHAAVMAHKQGTLGFAFSGGGFWFPYSLGAVIMARDLGILTPATPLAGASCGAIIVACVHAGLDPTAIVALLLEFAADCRTYGTAGRLGHVIKKFLTAALPSDAHKRCGQRTHIQLTKVLPFLKPHIISSWESKEDLVACVATSCHIPAYMDGSLSLMSRYRGKLWVDGGLVRHVPVVPWGASWVTGVSCVPVQFLQTLPGISRLQLLRACEVSPDTFHPFPFTWPQTGNLLLAPAEDSVLLNMVEMGKRDMLAWARCVGLLDEVLATRCRPGRVLPAAGSPTKQQGSEQQVNGQRLSHNYAEDQALEEWHDANEAAAEKLVVLRVLGGQIEEADIPQGPHGSSSTSLSATINVAPGARCVEVLALVHGQEVKLRLNL